MFFIEIEKTYSGALTDAVVGLKYQAFENLAFTFGANRFALDLEVNEDDYGGTLDSVFNGILLSVNANY